MFTCFFEFDIKSSIQIILVKWTKSLSYGCLRYVSLSLLQVLYVTEEYRLLFLSLYQIKNKPNINLLYFDIKKVNK